MGHRSAIEIEDQSELSFNDRVAREAIMQALNNLKNLDPDNPDCRHRLADAYVALRMAHIALAKPAEQST